MPSPENLFFLAETKCPKCEGAGGVTHSFQGKSLKVACDECGATGYVKIRLSVREVAEAILDMMSPPPNARGR